MTKIIDKLAWIEIRDKKILSTLSKGKDTYYIPGGKREPGESDSQALVREIKEELSVDLIEASLNYLGTFQKQAHGHADGIQVKMQCYTGKYEGTLLADSEIEAIVWLSYQDRPRVSPVDQVIFDWLKERNWL